MSNIVLANVFILLYFAYTYFIFLFVLAESIEFTTC